MDRKDVQKYPRSFKDFHGQTFSTSASFFMVSFNVLKSLRMTQSQVQKYFHIKSSHLWIPAPANEFEQHVGQAGCISCVQGHIHHCQKDAQCGSLPCRLKAELHTHMLLCTDAAPRQSNISVSSAVLQKCQQHTPLSDENSLHMQLNTQVKHIDTDASPRQLTSPWASHCLPFAYSSAFNAGVMTG